MEAMDLIFLFQIRHFIMKNKKKIEKQNRKEPV